MAYSKNLLRLYARDDGICHLCGGSVPEDAPTGSPLAPTRDHVKPRCAGGTLNNKALAHHFCNNRRGAKALNSKKNLEIDYEAELVEAVEKYRVEGPGRLHPVYKDPI